VVEEKLTLDKSNPWGGHENDNIVDILYRARHFIVTCEDSEAGEKIISVK